MRTHSATARGHRVDCSSAIARWLNESTRVSSWTVAPKAAKLRAQQGEAEGDRHRRHDKVPGRACDQEEERRAGGAGKPRGDDQHHHAPAKAREHLRGPQALANSGEIAIRDKLRDQGDTDRQY